MTRAATDLLASFRSRLLRRLFDNDDELEASLSPEASGEAPGPLERGPALNLPPWSDESESGRQHGATDEVPVDHERLTTDVLAADATFRVAGEAAGEDANARASRADDPGDGSEAGTPDRKTGASDLEPEADGRSAHSDSGRNLWSI